MPRYSLEGQMSERVHSFEVIDPYREEVGGGRRRECECGPVRCRARAQSRRHRSAPHRRVAIARWAAILERAAILVAR